MSKHFFITGYPRTMGAWWANWMTFGSVFCWHEMVNIGLWFKDIFYAIESDPRTFVGISDSFLPIVADRFIDRYPEARWLIVNRAKEESIDSLSLALDWNIPQSQFFDRLESGLKKIRKQKNVLEIQFHQPMDLDLCNRVQQHLAPGSDFCDKRFNLLSRMNVQIDKNVWKYGILKAAKLISNESIF